MNDVPYVFVTAASAGYKITYCNTWVQISTGMLNFALTKIQLGTLETPLTKDYQQTEKGGDNLAIKGNGLLVADLAKARMSRRGRAAIPERRKSSFPRWRISAAINSRGFAGE